MRRRDLREELRDHARLLVRAALDSDATIEVELSEAIRVELGDPNPTALAREWIAAARAALAAESWPVPTDHDRLVAVFAECEDAGIRVLQGVVDHWEAKAELDRLAGRLGERDLLGIAWFTRPDVWHAIDEGMLEVNLWHSTTANAAPGDELLTQVLDSFARHGLDAHFDEGRIEVSAHWHRRM